MYNDPSGHSAMSIGEAISCMAISSIVAVTYINIAESLQNRIGHVNVKSLVTGKDMLDELGNLIIDLLPKMQKDLIQVFPRVLELKAIIEVIPRSVIRLENEVILRVREHEAWTPIEPDRVLQGILRGLIIISVVEKESAEKGNYNKVKDNYLKQKDIDAHELKKDYLGEKAPIAKYDIYVNKDTGELYIFEKGGKGVGIPTGEFIK